MIARALRSKRKYVAVICILVCFTVAIYQVTSWIRVQKPPPYPIRTSDLGTFDYGEATLDYGSAPNLTCTPVRHVAFVKTHKCGTDTLAMGLLRLAQEYNLEVLLPRHYIWSLNWPRPMPPKSGIVKPRKSSNRFDMMTLHGVYDPARWDSFMEEDTAYITILRYPIDQMRSVFEYFSIGKVLEDMTETHLMSPLDEYLQHPERFDFEEQNYTHWMRGFNILKYPMSYDLGYGHWGGRQDAFVRFLSRKFRMVLILDHFDESMIVLKHELCWTTRDILMRKANKTPERLRSNATEQLSWSVRDALWRQLAPVDYAIYELFNATLWNKISTIPNFHRQVQDYRILTDKATILCNRILGTGDVQARMRLKANGFHDETWVDYDFCVRFSRPFLCTVDYLKRTRYNLTQVLDVEGPTVKAFIEEQCRAECSHKTWMNCPPHNEPPRDAR